jgi:hypothetical protein
MRRLERIRERVVERALIRQDWGECESPSSAQNCQVEFGKLGRHLLRQREERRRQIVDRLMELTSHPEDDFL